MDYEARWRVNNISRVNLSENRKVIVSHLGEVTNDARTVGDLIRYKIYYVNTSRAGASIEIVDALSKRLTRVRASQNGVYDESTHTLTWRIPSLPLGRVGFVEFEAVIKSAGRISNQALIRGIGRTAIRTNTVKTTAFSRPRLGWLPADRGSKPGAPPRPNMKDETTTGTTVRFDVPGVYVHERREDGVAYHVLSLPGQGALDVVGKPELPITGGLIEVPFDVDFSLEILKAESITLKGYNVYPVQPPKADASAKLGFVIDKMVYRANLEYPAVQAAFTADDVMVIRGHRVMFLKVNPIQFNPVSRLVKLYSMLEVRIKFNHPTQLGGVKRRLISEPFEELLKASLLNYKDQERFFQTDSDGGKEKTGCDYLIITHDAFYNENDPANPIVKLANWKRSKGYTTRVVKVGSITGGNTPASIKSYIQTAYDSWDPPPTYILLVGDSDLVRTYQGSKHPEETSHAQPPIETDLYYVTVDGTDYFPDIYIGRLSADTTQQVTDIVDKILLYEQKPPATPANNAFYDSVSLSGLFTDDDQGSSVIDGREGRPWIANLETIHDFLDGQNYTVERLYVTDSGFPANPLGQAPLQYHDGVGLPNDLLSPNYGWNAGTASVSNAFNNGRFLYNYRDHGSWDELSHPEFNNTDVPGLNANDLTSVVFSIACQTAWFDNETDDDTKGGHTNAEECLGEVILRQPRSGAVAFVGMTRNSYTKWNDFIMFGLIKAIWPDFTPTPHWGSHPTVPTLSPVPLLRMGQTLNFGKMYMANALGASDTRKIEFEMTHLFGDPEMPIWTSAPEELTVQHPNGIGANGVQEFIVNVSEAVSGDAVHNATVCLTRDGSIVQMQQTNTDDLAWFKLNNPGSGDIAVTVTCIGYRPYTGTITVVAGGAELNRLDPPDGPEGQTIHVGGRGFQNGENVDIVFGAQAVTVTATANASGEFGQGTPTTDVNVPVGQAHGPTNIIAHGQSSGRFAAHVFYVRDPNPVDLWTYDQYDSSTWQLYAGDNPTWNSPDIQLYDSGGTAVDSNNLQFGQTYTVKVNVRNKSAFQAKQAKVVFKWMNFGAGGPWDLFSPTSTINADVPAEPPGLTSAENKFTPQATGHLCIRAEIEHIEDVKLSNNQGQENLHIGYSSSPTEVRFIAWNTSKNPSPVHIEVRQLIKPSKRGVERLWGTWVKHPDPQVLQPGKRAEFTVVVDPDVADVKSGTTAEFAVTAFVERKIIGGVNLIITKKVG